MKRYKGAVIGCGRIGILMETDPKRIKPATHAGAYRLCPRTELSALVEVNPAQREKAKAIYPDVPIFADVATMLKEIHPDIVSVCTLPTEHEAIVLQCSQSAVPAIICEKPIADSVVAAQRMTDACQKSGSLLFINHTRRFDPLLRKAADLIHGGTLGPVMAGTAYYTAGLFNTATHLVDLVRFLMGDITRVLGLPEKRVSVPANDIGINGWLFLKGDIPVTMQCLEVKDYSIFELRIYLRKGCITIDRFGFTVEKTPLRECIDFSDYQELDVDHREREGKSRSLMGPLMVHTVACLDKTDKPVSKGEDGTAALKTLLALKESAEQGGVMISL